MSHKGRVVMGLRETLEAATPGPWTYRAQDGMVRDADAYFVVKVAGSPRNEELAASGRLAALAPELAALVLDMGEWMKDASEYVDPTVDIEHPLAWRYVALLARLDQLGKEQT